MKARIAGGILCRCGFMMQVNLEHEVMCLNPKCGGYEIRYKLPEIELKMIDKKEEDTS